MLAATAFISGCAGIQAQTMTLNVVDVGGALTLLQTAIESYGVQHPDVKFNFKRATAVDLPKTLVAAEGQSDIDLVLRGTDILAAGIDQTL